MIFFEFFDDSVCGTAQVFCEEEVELFSSLPPFGSLWMMFLIAVVHSCLSRSVVDLWKASRQQLSDEWCCDIPVGYCANSYCSCVDQSVPEKFFLSQSFS